VAFDARTTHESRHGTCDERASDVPGSADEAGDVCASPMRRDFHARFSPERLRKSKSETFWQNGATGCRRSGAKLRIDRPDEVGECRLWRVKTDHAPKRMLSRIL
jgi:hypothetical protein